MSIETGIAIFSLMLISMILAKQFAKPLPATHKDVETLRKELKECMRENTEFQVLIATMIASDETEEGLRRKEENKERARDFIDRARRSHMRAERRKP